MRSLGLFAGVGGLDLGFASSELIGEAVAATRWLWPATPPLGMVTFVDASKVRRKRDPGRCFRRAGFEPAGHTTGGLVALVLPPDAMPAARGPIGGRVSLFDDAHEAAHA